MLNHETEWATPSTPFHFYFETSNSMDRAIEPITNNFINWCVNGKNILKLCFSTGIRNIKIIKQVSKVRQLDEYSNRYESTYFLSLRA